MLSNTRHEKFCQSIVMGMSQKDSYIKAGYKARDNSAEAHSARLVRNGKVSKRIDEIQEKTAKKFEITKDKLLAELAKDATAKIKDKVRRAEKHKAIEIINKMCGYNEAEVIKNTGIGEILKSINE